MINNEIVNLLEIIEDFYSKLQKQIDGSGKINKQFKKEQSKLNTEVEQDSESDNDSVNKSNDSKRISSNNLNQLSKTKNNIPKKRLHTVKPIESTQVTFKHEYKDDSSNSSENVDADKQLESDNEGSDNLNKSNTQSLEIVNVNTTKKIENKTSDKLKFENIIANLDSMIEEKRNDLPNCIVRAFRVKNRNQECNFKYQRDNKLLNKQIGRQDPKNIDTLKRCYQKWYQFLSEENLQTENNYIQIKERIIKLFNDEMII